jgi:hypothetical protein
MLNFVLTFYADSVPSANLMSDGKSPQPRKAPNQDNPTSTKRHAQEQEQVTGAPEAKRRRVTTDHAEEVRYVPLTHMKVYCCYA